MPLVPTTQSFTFTPVEEWELPAVPALEAAADSASAAVGDKRKRDLDVIMIESDSDPDDDVAVEAAVSVPSTRQQNPSETLPNLNYRNSTGDTAAEPLPHVVYRSLSTPAGSHHQQHPQPPPVQHQRSSFATSPARSQLSRPAPTSFATGTNNSVNVSRYPQMPGGAAQQHRGVAVTSQSLAIEPFNRGGGWTRHSSASPGMPSPGMQYLGLHQVVSSDAYDTDSSSGISGSGVDMSSSVPPVVEEVSAPSYAPVAPPAPYQPPPTDGWDAGTSGNSPLDLPYGRSSSDFAMENGGVPDVPTPATATPRASGTLITTSADWTANPLEDILFDRYFQINLYTVNLEQHITRLNARIIEASVDNFVAAQQMTVTLRQQQSLLLKAQLNRTNALVALIVQSGSIMSKVKRLRMDTLSDIPPVPIASHRRCLELSQQITQYASSTAMLHQEMAVVLDSSGGMDPSTFHESVESINQILQTTERVIHRWKDEREAEIVRIVQYSNLVREELKRTFHVQKPPPPPPQSQPMYQHQPPHHHPSNGY